MDDSLPDAKPPERQPVTDAIRIQILATEHWGLLATRSMTWNEIFTRASMFITLLSASIVSLALVAQATGFGANFRVFALLVLTVTLLLGIGTIIRLGDAMTEDIWLLMSMNRLRHAYLDLAPDLEPYFTTGHHDDIAGIMRSRGPHSEPGPGRLLSATPAIVAIINAVLVGVIFGILTTVVSDSRVVSIVVGVLSSIGSGIFIVVLLPMRHINRAKTMLVPRFPE